MADKQSRVVIEKANGERMEYAAESLEEALAIENAPKKSVGDISVKVNVDVSEALTGLKAIQREAREAAKALRELDDAQKNSDLGRSGEPLAYRLMREKFEEYVATKTITDDITRSYE